jgi:large subunit ribosomal protein L23
MAIFKEKKESSVAKKPKTKPLTVKKAVPAMKNSAQISMIVHPRVTEKASNMGESNTFVFDVSPRSNKRIISEAIQELYKVRPVKVRIVQVPRKRRFVRGRAGFKPGGKKAYVFLKKGDKLD